MSWPLRFRFAAFLILAGLSLAGLSTSPASSNPFTELFNPAPPQAVEPAPAKDAKEACLPQPGKPADGQHWVYRVDGRRKCWFQVPEGTAAVKKTIAKRRPAASEENEAAPRQRSAVANAHAELLRPAPAQTPQPAPPAPAFRMVDAADSAPIPATGAAALVPPPPVLSKPDQLKPDDANSRRSNIEALFKATPADSDAVAVSIPPGTPVVVPGVGTGDGGPWWTAPWLGPLLMALGLVILLGMTRPLRRAALVAERWWPGEPEERPDYLHLESDPRARPHDRRHPQAAPHRSRPAMEDRRTRPSERRLTY